MMKWWLSRAILLVSTAPSRLPALICHCEERQRRGNLDEAEHTLANRRCYGDEIVTPHIKYGVAMTKWVRMRPLPWAPGRYLDRLSIVG